MNSIRKILFVVLILAAQTLGNTRLEIFLSARDLPSMDPCCLPHHFAPDTYAIFHYSHSGEDDHHKEQGRTEYISDDYNPNWPELYGFYIDEQHPGSFHIELWDDDLDSNDYVGYVTLTAQEILQAPGHLVEKNIIGASKGRVCVRGSVNGTDPLMPPHTAGLSIKGRQVFLKGSSAKIH